MYCVHSHGKVLFLSTFAKKDRTQKLKTQIQWYFVKALHTLISCKKCICKKWQMFFPLFEEPLFWLTLYTYARAHHQIRSESNLWNDVRMRTVYVIIMEMSPCPWQTRLSDERKTSNGNHQNSISPWELMAMHPPGL